MNNVNPRSEGAIPLSDANSSRDKVEEFLNRHAKEGVTAEIQAMADQIVARNIAMENLATEITALLESHNFPVPKDGINYLVNTVFTSLRYSSRISYLKSTTGENK